MIKSSDDKFDNTYHILKVLSNRDYLARNQHNNYFIFGQLPRITTSPNHRQDIVLNKSKNKNQNIIQSKETIIVEDNHYKVFDVGRKTPIWIKDIDKNKMSCKRFISNLVTESIGNILAQFVWLNFKEADEYLHIRNFWLIDGSLRLVMMPRHNQEHVTTKQQNRSQSHQNSKLSQMIDQTMEIMKRFAQILWQVIQPYLVIRQNNTYKIKALLQNMMTKKLSIDKILQEIKSIQKPKADLNISRSIKINYFNKGKLSNRRHTLQPSKLSNRRHTLQPSLLAKSPKAGINSQYRLKLESRCRTQLVRQYEASAQKQESVINSIFKQRPSASKNKWYLDKKGNSQSQTYSSSESKSRRYSSPQRRLAFAHNERERTKYLNWIRDKKMNLVQQVTRLSSLANKKFKQNIISKQPERALMDTSQLTTKLVSKALKFRSQKYRSVSNAAESQLIPFEINKNNQLNSILRRSEREKIMLQLESKILEEDIPSNQSYIKGNLRAEAAKKRQIQDENVQKIETQGYPSKQKFSSKHQESSIIDRRQISQEKYTVANHLQRPIYTKQTDHSFQRGAIDSVIENKQIQQLKCYDHSNYIGRRSQREREHNVKEELRGELNSHWLDTISKASGQKMKRIKMTKNDFINKEEDQIETIDLTYKESKIPEKHLNTLTSQIQQQRRKVEIFSHRSHSNQPPTSRQSSDLTPIVKRVTAAVKEYLMMINILGDISIKCVQAKKHLNNYEWRKSVFFLYQRFQYERDNLLEQLLNSKFQVIRRSQNIKEEQFEIWYESEEKIPLMETLKKENVQIAKTYDQFAKKTLQECGFQPMIQNFIKNRGTIIARNQKNLRVFISKYAIALIINQYDNAIEKRETNKEILLYIARCLFALRIIAELDGRQSGRQLIKVADYLDLQLDLQNQKDWVEQLYEAYYPEDKCSY